MKNIYLSHHDHRVISKLLEERQHHTNPHSQTTTKLRGELERAILVEDADLPPEVVKLHSRVRLRDLDTGEIDEWTLTLPDESDVERRKLSILAPVGSAIIGFAKGDQIEWETPGGLCHIQIEAVEEVVETPIPGLIL